MRHKTPAFRGHPDQLARGRLLDNELLHVFVTVILCRGFTRAAQVLNRTQAAVSMQIKRLEEIVQLQLFDRSQRTLVLTPSGRILRDYATRILALNEETMLRLHARVSAGPVRIGTFHQFATDVLPPILTAFAKAYPDVWVELHVGLTRDMHERFDNDFDLIISLEERAPVDATQLLQEQVQWYTSLAHKQHLREPLPVALLPEGSLFRTWAVESLAAANREWRLAQVCTNPTAIEATVEAGLAIGVFKEGTVTSDSIRPLGAADGFLSLPSVNVMLRMSRSRGSSDAEILKRFIIDKYERRL